MRLTNSLRKFIGAFTVALLAALGAMAPTGGAADSVVTAEAAPAPATPGDSAWG
ncbi:hypothetical protein GCM10010214_27340 [Streptomyces abikoensis]|nr:hypothetical protein GCM10010214_27340 [Streptomyces abikoensis]